MPEQHLKYIREIRRFELVEGRRPAGYVVASEASESFDDPGIFIELPLVNQIRQRVDKWRDAGYPGITSVTKELLEHWKNPDREVKLFLARSLISSMVVFWAVLLGISVEIVLKTPSISMPSFPGE